ncbi:hypothetical protein AGMMS49983_10880 [Clostridia bacterium]|nr:hypothetical protein AGMMS49983_10880 [Clostridia bacterium]
MVPFWETDLEGSNAGRFLLGAGNTLRFTDHPELKERMNALVDGIARFRDSDGYCMGFKKEDFMILERANYTRSWVTRGLIAAGYAGNQTAYTMIREFGNWFNSYKASGRAGKAAELHLSYQGFIAHTSLYLSEVGEEEDIKSGGDLYTDEDWLEQLIEQDTRSIWQHPNDGAHGYELNAMIAYLSMYAITERQIYLDAVLSARELFQKYWIHIGGSVAICEEHDAVFPYPPGSHHISADRHTGETCNNVWWLLLNQLLHQLFPEEEKYVRSMEESLYNVILPAQDKDKGIRYHAFLHGVKDIPNTENTCCEGTGTMTYGMLPEFIYSLAEDGISIDLFAGSEIAWDQGGTRCRLEMDTMFPETEEVKLRLTCDTPVRFHMRIRIPSWVSEKVCIELNQGTTWNGRPGSYLSIDRVWNGGEELRFQLPRKMKVNRYLGFTTVRGYERYAFTYGPILMALTGPHREVPLEDVAWNDKWLTDERSEWNHVHWELDAIPNACSDTELPDKEHALKPYYSINRGEPFTCFPMIRHQNTRDMLAPDELFSSGIRLSLQLAGDVDLILAGIPAGSFQMGQNGFEKCERPEHTVKITKPFYLGAYPVTQSQYECIMNINPSSHVGADLPVENVSFYDAEEFIRLLNLKYGKTGLRFCLPTEAQWEYAARAETKDIVGYATDILRDFSRYAWSLQQLGAQGVLTTSAPTSMPVGTKHQNMWGLYDMLGNVGEWCSDFYAPYSSKKSPDEDPIGPSDGRLKTIRGGTFTDVASYCRCAARNALEPEWANNYTGFRVAAEIIKG